VNVFFRKHQDRQKLEKACESFNCKPWLAVYVECENTADLYLTSVAHFDEKYKSVKATAIDAWSMSGRQRVLYGADPKIAHIQFEFERKNWPPLRAV
jgi:hypothetical protein